MKSTQVPRKKKILLHTLKRNEQLAEAWEQKTKKFEMEITKK